MADGVTIRALFVRLGVIADDDQAKRFDARLGQIKESMNGLSSRAKSFATGFAASIAAAFGGVAVTDAISQTAALGDAAAKTGEAIGLTAEQYQEFAFAADKSGVSAEQLRTGFTQLSRLALDAARGSKTAADEFANFRIETENADGTLKSQAELIDAIADRFQELETSTEQTALATKFFGESGGRLIPFLNGGAEGIAALREEARALGGVMSNETAASSEMVVDAMTNVRFALVGLRTQIASRLFPALISGGNALARWISEGNAAEKIVNALKIAVVALGSALSGLALARAGQGLASLGASAAALVPRVTAATAALVRMAIASTNLRGIVNGAGGLIRRIFSLNTAVVLLNSTLLALPLAIGAVLLAGQDLAVWLSGGNSLLGDFIDRWRNAEGPLGAAARALESIAPALAGAFEQIKSVAGDALPSLMSSAVAVATSFAESARDLLTEFGPPIIEMIGEVSQAVGEIAPRVFGAGRAIIGAAVRIIGALLPAFLSFAATASRVIGELAPLVAGVVGFVADLIAGVAPKAAAVLERVAELITGAAALALRVISAVVGFVSPIASRALTWWDALVEKAMSAIESIRSGIDSVMGLLGPLISGIDSAIDSASALFGFSGETTVTAERSGSILDTIRQDVTSAPQLGAAAGSSTVINVGTVETTVQPQPGATQAEAARLTSRSIEDSLERELQRAAREFG